MRPSMLVDLVAAATVLHLAAAAYAATDIQRDAAGAFFVHQDGCILTSVNIAGLSESTASAPITEAFVTRRDTCNGVDLITASERGEQSVSFVVQGFASASLAGSFGVFDFVGGAACVIDVRLAWDGEGAITHTRSPGQTQSLRSAVARGSVVLNGENLTPGASTSAALERIRIRGD
jgi:hypothetical protein